MPAVRFRHSRATAQSTRRFEPPIDCRPGGVPADARVLVLIGTAGLDRRGTEASRQVRDVGRRIARGRWVQA